MVLYFLLYKRIIMLDSYITILKSFVKIEPYEKGNSKKRKKER